MALVEDARTSVALAINEHGQVVGSADTSEGLRHAYLWEKGQMIDLGTLYPWVSQSEAEGINNQGQVVGILSSTGGISRSFIWENGQMTELPQPSIKKSAQDINDAGQIVGIAIFPDEGQGAFLLDDGVLTNLTSLGFPSAVARAINAGGDVAGGCCPWADRAPVDLGALGGSATAGVAVNDSRQVAGWSERVAGSALFHAFLWSDGEMTDVGALGGFERNRARGINNLGQVVGDANGLDFGFLYDRELGIFKLEDLLPPDSGWVFFSPRDINDKGQIVGSAAGPNGLHAFLMTPGPWIPAVSDYAAAAHRRDDPDRAPSRKHERHADQVRGADC